MNVSACHFLKKSKLMHFHIKILRHVWNGARDIQFNRKKEV